MAAFSLKGVIKMFTWDLFLLAFLFRLLLYVDARTDYAKPFFSVMQIIQVVYIVKIILFLFLMAFLYVNLAAVFRNK